MALRARKVSGALETQTPEAFFSKARKFFGSVKPFLVHLYIKTENCIRLKHLV